MSTLQATGQCFNLIEEAEGCRLMSYQCPSGIWTIGIGHTKGVKMGMTCSRAQAIKWFFEDIREREAQVNDLLNDNGVSINQNQFDSLISFVFNIGIGKFLKSTVWKLMKGDPNNPEIVKWWQMWNKGNYKDGIDNDGDGLIDEEEELAPLPGLVKRRKLETDLYFRT